MPNADQDPQPAAPGATQRGDEASRGGGDGPHEAEASRSFDPQNETDPGPAPNEGRLGPGADPVEGKR